MKKKVVLSIIFVLVMLCLSSCSKTAETKNVEALIENIGTVTLESEKAIKEAFKAYNALTDEEKEKVKNYEELESKKAYLDEVVTFNEDIEKFIKDADNNFTDTKSDISETLNKGKELLSQYNEMTDDRKALTEKTDELEAGIEKLSSYEKNSFDAAVAYVKAFYEVNENKKYTVTEIYCITQIRDNGDEYHMFALDYKDSKNKKHTIYANARFMSASAYDLLVEKADVFFADSPATENANPKKHGNLTLDIGSILQNIE